MDQVSLCPLAGHTTQQCGSPAKLSSRKHTGFNFILSH